MGDPGSSLEPLELGKIQALAVKLLRCPDAVEASGQGGVEGQAFEGDGLAALGAIAIFVAFQSGQGRLKQAFALQPPRAGRLGHRLLLHRIHPRQTANALLIKFEGFVIAGCARFDRMDLGNLSKDGAAQGGEVGRGERHAGRLPPTSRSAQRGDGAS